MNQLQRLAQIDYALRDIRETMDLHREKGMSDPYVQKLYREFDELVVEKYKIIGRRR